MNWGSTVHVPKVVYRTSERDQAPDDRPDLKSTSALVCLGIRDVLAYAADPIHSPAPGEPKRVVFSLATELEDEEVAGYAHRTFAVLFQLVKESGAVICIAAGNAGGTVREPAMTGATGDASAHVLAVGSVTEEDKLESGTCLGLANMVFAPGSQVLTTDKAPDEYDTENGTSMATPHVAGLASLLWSEAPHLSAAEIVKLVQGTCREPASAAKSTFIDPATGEENFGMGIIDPYAALKRVKTRICLVLDKSGSMGEASGLAGMTRLDAVKSMVSGLIDVIDVGTGLGILSFNENSTITSPLEVIEIPDDDPETYLGQTAVPIAGPKSAMRCWP